MCNLRLMEHSLGEQAKNRKKTRRRPKQCSEMEHAPRGGCLFKVGEHSRKSSARIHAHASRGYWIPPWWMNEQGTKVGHSSFISDVPRGGRAWRAVERDRSLMARRVKSRVRQLRSQTDLDPPLFPASSLPVCVAHTPRAGLGPEGVKWLSPLDLPGVPHYAGSAAHREAADD